MPRRRYYSVIVSDDDGTITTYTGQAAKEIVSFIQDSGLKPGTPPKPKKLPRSQCED